MQFVLSHAGNACVRTAVDKGRHALRHVASQFSGFLHGSGAERISELCSIFDFLQKRCYYAHSKQANWLT